jgi:biopolymer transport protein ExbD
MGAAIGTPEKNSRNIDLNIVPFIDLMSCLTAFLLVTAVWVNIASLQNQAAGRARDSFPADEDPPKLSILIDPDQMTVTQSPTGDARQVAAKDWVRLESALREFKTPGGPDNQLPRVEVAANSTNAHPIAYDQLVAAMDAAVRVGYPHVGVTDPQSLAR